MTDIDKILKYLKRVEERLQALEKPPVKNLQAPGWTIDEMNYLKDNLEGVDKLRPVLLKLTDEWYERFGHQRTYDAMRKKWTRMKH